MPTAPSRASVREGLALVEAFRGDVLVWVRIGADGADRALPPARSVLVPMAAAGSRHRGQHRRRLPALQQIVQLLLFGARSLGLAHAQTCCFKSLLAGAVTEPPPAPDEAALAELAASARPRARAELGRSLAIREVDAGSCNGCELEIHALNNAFYDLERFGLRFVASPRHADVLLVTGPVTKNMREALERTYARDAGPEMGGGGRRLRRSMAAFSPAAMRWPAASSRVVPVDLHIRGCPPTPGQPCSKACSRSFPAPDLLRKTAFPIHLIAKDDPGRGMIARAGHTSHVAIDTGIEQTLRRLLAQKQMIEAEPCVARPAIP